MPIAYNRVYLVMHNMKEEEERIIKINLRADYIGEWRIG